MENEKDLSEQEYLDLYNKGYGIYQFSPELAELVTNATSNDFRFSIMQDAIAMAEIDARIEREFVPDWLKEDRFKENGNDISLDLDKDNEPEDDL